MWTHNVVESKKEKGNAVTIVDFTNDVTEELKREVFRVDNLNSLKVVIQSRLDALNAAYDFAESAPKGEIDLTIPPPEPPPDLTPEELARIKFLQDLALMRQMEKAIAAGLKKSDDEDYVNQVALVKSEFLEEYVGLI